MNNLKRVLSLALSGIMLVGMMAVGASAADFVDADEIQHEDAVNVLVALNVINGKDDGSHFDPTGDVTRAEMAKMIAVAMNGGTDTNTGVKTAPTFTDIDGHWAESYIEYCSDLGVISGRGDGTFDPNGNVTGLEATKMVLTALGYDATAYRLTGASWAVRTDELARAADPNLYDELQGVVMSSKASRDTAAQLIWNGLQNETRKVTPDTNTSTGEVTWQYQPGGQTMLKARYGADVWIGTYEGNSDSLSGVDDGCIRIGNAGPESEAEEDRDATATFTSDLGIENIGEEVKVVYKDVTGGTPNKPDKRDMVYGAFNTGKTEVYNITKNDLQDADNAKKIKFGDSKYDTKDATITVVTNYDGDGTAENVTKFSDDTASGYRVQSVDQIKFVCDNDGKITRAYIVEVKAGKISGISSSKVTISGVGAIDIDDNDIYADAKKDDVVVYTRFYDNSDKDSARFTVTKAEEAEGELTGYKKSSDVYNNVVVDGKTYKVNNKVATLADLTDDAITAPDDEDIGDTVRVYLAGGMAVAMQSIETSGGNYALVTEVSSNSNGAGNNMDPLKVTVLLPDGTEQTLTVHKDSTSDGTKKITAESNAAAQEALFAKANTTNQSGVLIEYSSISNGSIKIKEIFSDEVAVANDNGKLWDKDTKALTTGSKITNVAATDAVLFVGVDTNPETPTNKVEDFYAYDLRGLGNILISRMSNDSKIVVKTNDDGLVKAAYVMLLGKPGSSTSDTLYGIITGYVGRRNNADGDTLYRYTVAVNRDEELEISVDSQEGMNTGNLITFDETANGEYVTTSDITVITNQVKDWTLAAVRSYSEGSSLLSYYTATERANSESAYEGKGDAVSKTVAKDVKIVYVNTDDEEDGDDVGIGAFDSSTGYANIVFHTDSDGLVDVVIVETSDVAMKVSGTGSDQFGTTADGATYAVTKPADTTVSGNSGEYTAEVDKTTAEKGATVTVTVKVKTAVQSGSDTVKVTSDAKVTITGSDKTVDNTASVGDTVGTWTFTMPEEAVDDLKINVSNGG